MVTSQEVQKAARAANIHAFVASLPLVSVWIYYILGIYRISLALWTRSNLLRDDIDLFLFAM